MTLFETPKIRGFTAGLAKSLRDLRSSAKGKDAPPMDMSVDFHYARGGKASKIDSSTAHK